MVCTSYCKYWSWSEIRWYIFLVDFNLLIWKGLKKLIFLDVYKLNYEIFQSKNCKPDIFKLIWREKMDSFQDRLGLIWSLHFIGKHRRGVSAYCCWWERKRIFWINWKVSTINTVVALQASNLHSWWCIVQSCKKK